MPSNHLILSSPSPPALNLSQHQGLFQWVSSSHQVAKVLEFQLQHQSYQWTPRTVSFRMDWLDLLAVQGTLKSLLQHHSSKASILLCSAFFIVQLSHPYLTTGKTIALTRGSHQRHVEMLVITKKQPLCTFDVGSGGPQNQGNNGLFIWASEHQEHPNSGIIFKDVFHPVFKTVPVW